MLLSCCTNRGGGEAEGNNQTETVRVCTWCALERGAELLNGGVSLAVGLLQQPLLDGFQFQFLLLLALGWLQDLKRSDRENWRPHKTQISVTCVGDLENTHTRLELKMQTETKTRRPTKTWLLINWKAMCRG